MKVLTEYSQFLWFIAGASRLSAPAETISEDPANVKCNLSPIGEIVAEEWQKTPQIRPNVELDAWIVMPNHLWGLRIKYRTQRHSDGTSPPLRPMPPLHVYPPKTLGAIIGQFKSVGTKRIWAAGFRDFAWQTRFYDHILHDEKSLHKIREYIINHVGRWKQDGNNAANIYM